MPERGRFETPAGRSVPAVTAEEMETVDRVAVEKVGLGLLQMMENAGRALAQQVRAVAGGPVAVLAGSGGNGGGGLAAARHLSNHEVDVRVVLDREPGELDGAAADQHGVVEQMDVPVSVGPDAVPASAVLVDALVGYGLSGPLRGTAASLVDAIDDRDDSDDIENRDATVVSLDVPSGVDATTGDAPGPHVSPDLTVTLALPKTGLRRVAGDLVLADIGIPAVVYRRAGIEYRNPFDEETVALTPQASSSGE